MEAAMADNETTSVIEGNDVAQVEAVIGSDSAQDDGTLGDAGKSALAKERAAARAAEKKVKEYEARIKEFEDRDKTESQRLQEERDALKAERDNLHLENLRRDVAEEKGLTPAQARRLVGTTREELESDADDVIATFPVKKAPAFGDVGQGVRVESGKPIYSASRDLSRFDFYQANKADILLAQREGRIID
jgi:hypothetical protein